MGRWGRGERRMDVGRGGEDAEKATLTTDPHIHYTVYFLGTQTDYIQGVNTQDGRQMEEEI